MFSRLAGAAALALGLGLMAVPAVAADSMMAAPACSADALHSAMASAASKMSAMSMSGSADKDYAAAVKQLMDSEHMLNAWEMKCGKNAGAMKMAEKMQKSLDVDYSHIPSARGQ